MKKNTVIFLAEFYKATAKEWWKYALGQLAQLALLALIVWALWELP